MSAINRDTTAATAILEIVRQRPEGVVTSEICDRLKATPQALGEAFEALREESRVVGFAGLWLTPEGYRTGVDRFLRTLREEHAKTPSLPGIPGDRVARAAGLAWDGKPLDRILAELASRGLITVSGTEVREGSFQPDLPARQRRFLDRVIEAIEREPVSVLPPHEIARTLGAPHQAVLEIVRIGVQTGELVNVGEGIYYTPRQLDGLRERVRGRFGKEPFSPNEFRDKLSIARRYAEPLAEHFDTVGFTVREDGKRTVRS